MKADTGEMIESVKRRLGTGVQQIRRSAVWANCIAPGLGRSRGLPALLVLGGQRCGTSTMFDYLAQHPALAAPRAREVHYFDFGYHLGERWYRAFFPRESYLRSHHVQSFDISPYYLFHPLAPQRVADALPGCKLLVLMRNPVDRAFSHYHMEVRKGREPLGFSAALEAEDERLAGEEDKMRHDPTYYSWNHHRYAYRARGRYVEQLQRWLALFRRKQFLFLKSEDLFENPNAELDRTCQFLDIPPFPEVIKRHRNQTTYTNKIDETVRQTLSKEFAAANRDLRSIAGARFGW